MNYLDIKSLALGYADRTDQGTEDQCDNFLRIVEARINKKLKTQSMGSKTSLTVIADQLEYDLPDDFAGMRDIRVVDGSTKKRMTMVSPDVMTDIEDDPSVYNNSSEEKVHYLIIGNQLKIFPAQPDTATIDLVYYKQVPPLTSEETENWLSIDHPDCYTFGLVVEISAFVKDADAKAAWDARFIESLIDIHTDDKKSRWSGSPMQISVE